ncbi:MAG: DUF2079 domain-containing protein [Oscillospiraceae bacterium]|nr:DUF2079 domain-containing protein [Oscillospiraceae bacterium]
MATKKPKTSNAKTKNTKTEQQTTADTDVKQNGATTEEPSEAAAEAVPPEKTPAEEATEEVTAEETGEEAASESSNVKKTAADSETKTAEKASEEKEPVYSLRTLVTDVGHFLHVYQLPDMLLCRLISLYFLVSGFLIMKIRKDTLINASNANDWKYFIEHVSERKLMLFAGTIIILGFITLSAFSRAMPKKAKISDPCAAIASVLFYDIALLWRSNNFYLTMPVSIISLVFIYYAVGKLRNREVLRKVSWKIGGVIVLLVSACITAFIAYATICKHYAFGTACHDFGLFLQMFHSLADNLRAITTCERDKALSHFYVHSSYIYYLLVPFFKLFPKAETLLIAQAVLAIGGVIPAFLIAKRHNIKGFALIFISFAYCFSVCIVGPCFYDFHENAFLPTLLMWLFWALDGRKMIASWIFAFLVCMVKEDAPLYIICIGLFWFFENKGYAKRVQGIIMALASGAYMMFITSWLTANGDGSMMTSIRFGNLMIDQEGGLKEVVKNVLLDPSYFFSLLIHEDTLKFFLQVMLPLLFLPFFTKKIHRFWLMIPFAIMNMSVGAGYGYASNIGFHYIFGPFCLLFYAAVLNLEDMGDEKKQELSVMLGAASIIFFFGHWSHELQNIDNYKTSGEHFNSVDRVLDSIPKDAVVAADAFFVAHCADHKEVYLFDMNDVDQNYGTLLEPDRYDFIAFGPNSELGNTVTPMLETLGFTVYDQYESRVIVYQSPFYQGT